MALTSHVINLSIDFDLDSIENIAKEKAINTITENVEKTYFTNSYYGGFRSTTALDDLAEKVVNKIYNEHKDEIFDIISDKVVEKLNRSNKFREAVMKQMAVRDKK